MPLADLDGQAREAMAQLVVALGVSGELALVDAPSFPETPPPAVDDLLADARGRRPEPRAAVSSASMWPVIRSRYSFWAYSALTGN